MENTTCNESVKLEEQKKRTKYMQEIKQEVADCINNGVTQKEAAIQFGISHFLIELFQN